MAQHNNFWKIHGVNGERFKAEIIDKGYHDNKILFPIQAIFDNAILELYIAAVIYKRFIKSLDIPTKEQYDQYEDILWSYRKELPKYNLK